MKFHQGDSTDTLLCFPFPLHALFISFHHPGAAEGEASFQNTGVLIENQRTSHCKLLFGCTSAGNHGNPHSFCAKNPCSAQDTCKEQLPPACRAWSSALHPHAHCAHRLVQTEELMSSLVIWFVSPPDTLLTLLRVFGFPCRSYTFQ